jgi:hypothetical protein
LRKTFDVHQLLAGETLADAYRLLENFGTRLRGDIHAVVFLSLKRRGRGKHLTPLSQAEFTALMQNALKKKIPLGFDSCSAPKVVRAWKDLGLIPPLELVSPCESACESLYCNVEGRFFPCSFTEDGPGLSLAAGADFYRDIWFHPQTAAFRKKLLAGVDENAIRRCPVHEV